MSQQPPGFPPPPSPAPPPGWGAPSAPPTMPPPPAAKRGSRIGLTLVFILVVGAKVLVFGGWLFDSDDGGSRDGGTGSASTPLEAYASYVTATERGDCEAMLDLSTPSFISGNTGASRQEALADCELFAEESEVTGLRHTARLAMQNGNRAEILTRSAADLDDGPEVTVIMKRVDGDWKVDGVEHDEIDP